MSWASTAPAAMDALVDALSDVSATVVLGPVVTASSTTTTIIVGYGGDGQDQPVVESVNQTDGMAVSPTREQYAINCAVIARSGSSGPTAVTTVRDTAMDVMASVSQALIADKTLGAVVMLASLGAWHLLLQQTSRGSQATVTFAVDVTAYSQR